MKKYIKIFTVTLFSVILLLSLAISVGAEYYEPDGSSSTEYLFTASECDRKVIVNSEMSLLGAAEIFSHEAYGHALLYIRNGGDHNGATHQFSGTIDMNLTLKDMIFKSRKETVKNYNK